MIRGLLEIHFSSLAFPREGGQPHAGVHRKPNHAGEMPWPWLSSALALSSESIVRTPTPQCWPASLHLASCAVNRTSDEAKAIVSAAGRKTRDTDAPQVRGTFVASFRGCNAVAAIRVLARGSARWIFATAQKPTVFCDITVSAQPAPPPGRRGRVSIVSTFPASPHVSMVSGSNIWTWS
jgi:hypothetical protein